MNSGRFAISVHILTLLATAEEEWCASDFLAGSININPVLVRKELSNLRKNGLIQSKEGKNGGSMLAMPASKIKMSQVYKAVKQPSLLGVTKNTPNPHCRIGRQINKQLDALYTETELALVRKLEKVTLADFYKKFN